MEKIFCFLVQILVITDILQGIFLLESVEANLLAVNLRRAYHE
jgi:hypothetical protein